MLTSWLSKASAWLPKVSAAVVTCFLLVVPVASDAQHEGLDEIKRALSDNDFASALAIADQLLANGDLSTSVAVSALGLKSTANINLGNTENALANLTSALDLSPGDFWLLMRSCQDHASAGYLPKALRDCSRARWSARRIRDDQEADAAAQFLLFSEAGLDRTRGFPESALAKLDELDTFATQNVATWFVQRLRGGVLSDIGRSPEALDAFSQALAASNGQSNEAVAEVHLARGIQFFNLGQNEQALDDIEAAVRLDPDDDWHQYILCSAHLTLEDNQSAVASCERLVEIESENPIYIDALGIAQHRSGLYKESRETFERALSMEPGNPIIQRHFEGAITE